jgi:protein SCO1/2
MRSLNRSVVTVGLCLGLVGCTSQPQQKAAPAPAQPAAQPAQAEQRFDMKGKVVSVDKSGKNLIVDHEAIPGFMGAMTMPYPVKDERLLENLTPGEQITAKVVSGRGGVWLEEIAPAPKELPKELPK